MERPFVGEAVPLRAEFRDDAGQPVAATGVTFVIQRVDGSAHQEVPGQATAEAHVFTALVPVPSAGTWEAQGRCSGPSMLFTERRKFEAVAPLDFAP